MFFEIPTRHYRIVLDIGKNNKIVSIKIFGAMEVLNLNNLLPINYSDNRKEVMV